MARRFSLDRLMHLLPLLIGLALLVAAAATTVSQIIFRAGAEVTQARIVEMRASTSRERDGRDSTVYYPVYEFDLPDGRRVRTRGPVGSATPCCEVGDLVRVLYDPAHPERAGQDSFEDSWLLPTVLGAFGALMFGAGVLVWRVFGGEAASPKPAVRRFEERALARVAGVKRIETADGPRWIVQARLDDPLTQAERIFASEPLPFDPSAQLRSLQTVPVEYDRDPRGGFRMDLHALRPPVAPVVPRDAAPASRDVTRLNGIAMDGSEPVTRSLPLTLLCIGAVLLLGAVALAWPQLAFRIGAASAPGLVVDMRVTSGGSAPVFTFTPPGGREMRVVSPIVSNPPCCHVGEAVTVRYRPEEPRRARIASLQDDWLLPGVLTGFAMLWLLPGLMALRARRIFLRRGGVVASAREDRPPPPAVEPPGHGVPVPLAG
ncbi:DUF3592 domain-containing protein, partial [Roseomonas rosulenta]|uniref:DUF3592 domain-containing protein n=1 Tax=Roseomonas rosulenta TaxID=2748667 RepID=UPI0018DF3969